MTRRHASAPSADAIAEAMPDYEEQYCAAVEGAWSRREPGVSIAVAGVPAAPLNCLSILAPGVRRAALERLLDELTATGLPYSVEARPGMDATAAAVASRRGMTPDEDIPLMCATSAPGHARADRAHDPPARRP